MVLSFALCATVVFAQNANLRSSQELKVASKATTVQTDLNKALFVKDGTPLLTVDFHDGTVDDNSVWTGTGYNTGVVTGGLEGHGQNFPFARWRRWPNVDQSTIEGSGDNTMSSVYSYMYQTYFTPSRFATYMLSYLDTATSSAENGFMMMSMVDQRTDQTGNFNAYIQFSTVDASAAGVIDVQFYQYYRKFYDFCYIDYRIGSTGSWASTEINVGGVDVSVNSALRGFATYTLPLAAAGNDALNVRIRYISLNSHRSNAYGYFWIIDDVSIIAAEADRLLYSYEEYTEGSYGIIPQNMEINAAWYGSIMNNGAHNQTNVTATINHINADMSETTTIDTYNNGTATAGEWMDIACDHYGWIYHDTMDYRGWSCFGREIEGRYGTGEAMPTAELGSHYLYANVTTDVLDHSFDTMHYQVVGLESNLIAGGAYRWGHDNGVLTYSPYNHYIFGFVQDNGHTYVTEDPEDVLFYAPGYYVTTAFKTGDNVPAGWVIRGVELVSTPVQEYQIAGTAISGLLIFDSCDAEDEGSVRFMTVNTGAGVHTITSDDLNSEDVIGRNSNGYLEMGNYHTVVLPFPEQPALRPNSTFRAGYTIEEDGYFALAQESWGSYRHAINDNTDTIIYFRNDPSTKKYAHPFVQNGYQVLVYDGNFGSDRTSGTIFAVNNYENKPMIHLLVGPQQQVERVNVTINCDSIDFGDVAYGGEAVCGSVITPVEGSSPIIVLSPMQGCSVASFKVDGVEIEPYNEDDETGDPNYTERENCAMQYRFMDIEGDHTIEVVFTEQPCQVISIDPVAANVNMNLQPNPATSQVTLNVEGVEGMLECAIIDMSGRVVYNSTFNAANEQVINLSNIAKGAYFVRITNNNFSKVEKLIVR